MKITRKQHVLSATLQREWADENGKVADCKVGNYPSLRLVKPDRTGFVRDYLPPAVANEAEAVWRTVEDLAPEALGECQATDNPSQASLEVVSDLTALHLARSHRSREDWDAALEAGLDESGVESLLAEPQAGPAFFRAKTGLVAAGPEAAEIGVEFARKRTERRIAELQFREFARRFGETRAWLRSMSCVVRKTDAQLFIADDPVLLFGDAGLVRAPGQAAWVMMPIGPFALMEWPHPGHQLVVDAELVGLLNAAQVRSARVRVIARTSDKDELLNLVTRQASGR